MLTNKMSDKNEQDGPKLEVNKSPVSARRAKKLLILSEYLSKQESRNNSKKVSRLLRKADIDLTEEERDTLGKNQDIVKRIHKNKERRILSEQRTQETEDTEEELQTKCAELTNALLASKRTVIYTGAGISTAASIPDYRGPQGVWTLLQKGEELKPQDLSDAEPTATHMCITELQKQGHVAHVVSQNCDGLHLRSGFPRKALSEVHGNMYIEICYTCKPHREYIRMFDVTENTGVRRHYTGRYCHECKGELRDTIVHFGEKGRIKSPYRWKEAGKAANKCDLILCLGTSLKVLKKYACLWCMDRVKQKRPNLIVVNLQWTPKDEAASLKINGRCDDVMLRVLKNLSITPSPYKRELDPIFMLGSSLQDSETQSMNKKSLVMPECVMRQRSDSTMSPVLCSDTESDTDSSSEEESSDEECSESSETDDEEVEDDKAEVERAYYQGNYRNNSRNHVEEVDGQNDQEKMVMLKKKCLERSQQICNEALQKRLHDQLSAHHSLTANHISSIGHQANAMHRLPYNCVSGTNHIPIPGSQNYHLPMFGCQDEHSYSKPKTLTDMAVGAPGQVFSRLTYDERLHQLQTLQEQLKQLKEKQKEIQQQKLVKDHRVNTVPMDAEIMKQEYSQSLLVPTAADITRVEQANSVMKADIARVEQANSMIKADIARVEQANLVIKGEIGRVETHRKMYQETQLCDLKQRIEREKHEMKQQHGNEYLRLSQHYIIQQQMIEQTGLGPQRHAENVRWYEEQQQLMRTRQTFQLQDLLTRHQALERDLHEHLNIFRCKMDEKIKELKASLKQRQSLPVILSPNSRRNMSSLNSNMVLSQTTVATPGDMKSPNSRLNMSSFNSNMVPQTTVATPGDIKSPIKSASSGMKISRLHVNTNCGQRAGQAPVLKSPPQTDHSIVAIMSPPRKTEPQPEIESLPAIPGFYELVSTLTMCDLCKSQNAYQRVGHKCSRCEEQRQMKQCHTLANFHSPPHPSETPCVPNVYNHPAYAHKHDAHLVCQTYDEDHRMFDKTNEHHDAAVSYTTMKSSPYAGNSIFHNNHTYLQDNTHLMQAGLLKGRETEKNNFLEDVQSKSSNQKKDVRTSASTSDSVANELELSPVIPYARANDKKPQNNTIVIHEATNSNESTDEAKTFGTSQTIIGKVAEDMQGANQDVKIKSENENFYASMNKPSDAVKSDNKVVTMLSKPIRSHSQSELYDQKPEGSSEKRAVRSRSQSEIYESASEVPTQMDESASGEASPVDDSVVKTQKKRKQLSRTVSVPGWFGKGLNLKRKKRY